jgi:hypothetical protein
MWKRIYSRPRAPIWLVTIIVLLVTGALWAIICCVAIEILRVVRA